MSQTLKDFVRGMGYTLDLGATMTRSNPRRYSSQSRALSSYWKTVGSYLNSAGGELEESARSSSSQR